MFQGILKFGQFLQRKSHLNFRLKEQSSIINPLSAKQCSMTWEVLFWVLLSKSIFWIFRHGNSIMVIQNYLNPLISVVGMPSPPPGP